MKRYFSTITIILSITTTSVAQLSTNQLSGQANTITTAVPFLTITPDTRAGGMGDVGVASLPDANSIHWNASKLAFADKKIAFSVSYTPWLRALVPDIRLGYLSGYYKITKNQAIGSSFRYFSLGNIQLTNAVGTTIGVYKPYEYAYDLSYSMKLSERWSTGLAFRYIYSNLTGGVTVGGQTTFPGRSIAGDFSVFYQNEDIKVAEQKSKIAFGMNVTNVGTKISYTSDTMVYPINATGRNDFIPMNLRLGGAFTTYLNELNSVSLLADINKLLVPSPALYATYNNGSPKYGANGKQIILAGMDPDQSIFNAIKTSFYDAPGEPVLQNGKYVYLNSDSTSIQIKKSSVRKEELSEINYSLGFEYSYKKIATFRMGYFHEAKTKGDRQFLTIGAGVKIKDIGVDIARIIPTIQRSPLAQTWRFSLTFGMEVFKPKNETVSE